MWDFQQRLSLSSQYTIISLYKIDSSKTILIADINYIEKQTEVLLSILFACRVGKIYYLLTHLQTISNPDSTEHELDKKMYCIPHA